MATINRITATRVAGYTFNISLYSGSGPTAPTTNLLYDAGQKSVTWNHQGLAPGMTHVGSFQADFEHFGTTDQILLKIDNGGPAAVTKGGVILRPSSFPPKPGKKNPKWVPLNQAVSDAFDLQFLDFKETSPNIWSANIVFKSKGTNFYSLQSTSVVTINTEQAFQVLVTSTGQATDLNVLIENINYLSGLNLPVIIHTQALVSGSDYLEQCDFKSI